MGALLQYAHDFSDGVQVSAKAAALSCGEEKE